MEDERESGGKAQVPQAQGFGLWARLEGELEIWSREIDDAKSSCAQPLWIQGAQCIPGAVKHLEFTSPQPPRAVLAFREGLVEV